MMIRIFALLAAIVPAYAGAADTYPQDVAFLQFDIHYEIDSLGGEEEYAKT